jgi:DNA-directed RNA polymerase subunit F
VVENEAKPTSLAEVKNILKKIEKERGELLYEQKTALEHAIKFSKITEKKTIDLINELTELKFIQKIQAFKIADILPTTDEDIKTIFAKERTTLSENEIKKVLEIVNKYNN